MVNGLTLAKATKHIVEALNSLETLSEAVLRGVMVGKGFSSQDARGVLDKMVKSGLVQREGLDQLSLTPYGRGVARGIKTYVSQFGEKWSG